MDMTDSAPIDDSVCTDATGRQIVLSTHELASTERRVLWADTLDATYCEMDVDWRDGMSPFEAELAVRPYGKLTMSLVKADPHTVVRTPAMIASDPNDDYLLCLITHGSVALLQNGREAVLEQGAFAILDATAPFVVDGVTEFEQVVVRAPRELLDARLPPYTMHDVTGAGFSGRAGMGRIVSRLLVELATTSDPLSTRSAASVADSALDLLVATIGDTAPASNSTRRVHHQDFQSVQRMMERYLHDPDHTTTEISAELGMSVRYIHKLFSAAGTTPRTWLYELRLDRARTQLLTTDLTVAEISEHVGFRDVSHFSRAFRRRFGASPAQFRRHGTATQSSTRPGAVARPDAQS